LFKKLIASILISAIALSSAITIGATQNPTPTEDGLILHYDFNETKGTKVIDKAGNFDGELKGNTTRVQGFEDGAIYFPGDKGDYISMPGAALAKTDDITISTWIKLEENSNWSVFFVAGSNTANCISFSTKGAPPTGLCGVTISLAVKGGTEERVKADVSNSVQVGEWANLVYTQEGINGKLYLNGEMVGSNTTKYKIKDVAQGSVSIGASHIYPDPNMVGKMEDFKIYNRALSSDEIRKEDVKSFAELQALIATADQKVQKDYLSESWSIFTKARDDAKLIAATAAEQAIAHAFGVLKRALNGLEKVRIKVACVGDSITYGELCTNGNVATQSYPAQMQALLGDEYKVYNYGVNGATMMKDASKPYTDQSAYSDSLKCNPDIVIIMLGTNDANGSNPPKLGNFTKDALDLVETYKNLESNPKIYIATSATCYFTDAQPGIITDRVVPMQKFVAEQTGSTLIDIHESTKNIKNLFPDNLHPDVQGYGLIAGVMCAALVREKTPTPAITELASVYAKAQAVERAGQKKYTDNSWNSFKMALAETKSVFSALDTLEDAQIPEKITSLKTAMGSLSEKPVELIADKVAGLKGISVPYGTAFEKLPLPKTAIVTLQNGSTVTCPIVWQKGNYNGTIKGGYTLKGTLQFSNGIQNPLNLNAVISVTVQPQTNTWVKTNGKWYYFNSSGAMATGWTKVSGTWYCMNSSGVMQTGWKNSNGKWYYLNSSGAMATGWTKISGKWYYMNSTGIMQTGWKKISGKWYYFEPSGKMIENTSKKIGKKVYKFNKSGVCTNP
jgi:lysophospholipase L1-like esterase